MRPLERGWVILILTFLSWSGLAGAALLISAVALTAWRGA